MSADPRLDELVSRFKALEAAGQAPSAEELCADCPELLADLRRSIGQGNGPRRASSAARRRGEVDQRADTNAHVGVDPGAPSTLRLGPEELKIVQAPVSASAYYRDLKYLDGGGLGEVFRAREYHQDHSTAGRSVALKFIKRDWMTDAECRARFEREADVTARLDHPGVVPVYSVGVARDGRPFYAMRLIEGRRLEDDINAFHKRRQGGRRARRLELRALLQHLISSANTIAYAHHRGVAHLDIKPANIMIGSFGETLVVDWGLAVPIESPERYLISLPVDQLTGFIDSGDQPSATGVGTLPYMSPEQCDDTWGKIGPPSDIYALGATLYCMLTNRTPFSGRNFEQDYREPKKRGDFPRPRTFDRQIPRALEAICVKAMSPRPEDRYGKATDFAADIERWLADEPVTVYRERFDERLVRLARRHQNWTLSLAGALIVVMLIAIAAAGVLGKVADSERQAHENESKAREAAEKARQSATKAAESSLRMAARFAARTVGSEIDHRLRILESRAADSELIRMLQEADAAPPGAPPPQGLQAWIEMAKDETQSSTKADSWFLTDNRGIQIARAPYDSKTVGHAYWYRDYFHGQGLDLYDEDSADVSASRPDNIAAIREPHLSNVFLSTSSGRLKVAFSIPVWPAPAERTADSAPLGVLAMSVEAGEFKVLQTGLGANQTAALIDLRPDVVEGGEELRGIILHHPGWVHERARRLAGDGDFSTDLPRIEPELVATLDALRKARLRQLSFDGEIEIALANSLNRDYHDPLDPDVDARYLAVFEPVIVKWRTESRLYDSGWVVIVQERLDEAQSLP